MPALTFTADNTTDQLTATAHGQNTGDGPGRVFTQTGTLPTGLTALTDYWFIRVDANTLRLATSQANALANTFVNFTTNGSGTLQLLIGLPYTNPRTYVAGSQLKSIDLMSIFAVFIALWNFFTGQVQSLFGGLTLAQPFSYTPATFTADPSSDALTMTAHGLVTGDGPFRPSNSGGALPGGLVATRDYWIIFVDANTVRLSSSLSGAISGLFTNITSAGSGTQTLSGPSATHSAMAATFNCGVSSRLTRGPLVWETIEVNLATGNNNDLNPTGLSTAIWVALNGPGSPVITGIAGGIHGRALYLWNAGVTTISIAAGSGSSALENTFSAAINIAAGQLALVMYRERSGWVPTLIG